MLIDLLLKGLLGVLPVIAFLAVLVHFDSFKLVRLRIVLFTIAGGGLAAVAAYFVNTYFIENLDFRFGDYLHLGGPFVEEILTACVVVALIHTNRIGFAFDAAILGFAAGAGFALIENFYYLQGAGADHIAKWTIRGFGTAIMHGGTTSIFAMAGHIITMWRPKLGALGYVPGLLIAIGLHSGFNFFLDFPVTSTAVLIMALPLVMTILLRRDQKSIHDWLRVDFDEHQALLGQIKVGDFENSPAGRFLIKLHERFDHSTVSTMVAYIELHTELILAAEKVLEAHEEGKKISVDIETKEKLVLLHELEQEIGHTGLLALRPHLHFNRHEFWEIYMLEKEAGFAHPHAH